LTPITEERKWVFYFVCTNKISINSRDKKQIILVRCDAFSRTLHVYNSDTHKNSETCQLLMSCFYDTKRSSMQFITNDILILVTSKTDVSRKTNRFCVLIYCL
jgi:hypothetical protein